MHVHLRQAGRQHLRSMSGSVYFLASSTMLCGISVSVSLPNSLSNTQNSSIMDGLRELAKVSSPSFPLEFSAAHADDKFAAATIALPRGQAGGGGLAATDFQRLSLGQDDLRNFYSDNNNPENSQQLGKGPPASEVVHHTLKIVSIPRQSIGAGFANILNVDRFIFQRVLRDMRVDPCVEHLIRSQAYGLHHSRSGSTTTSSSDGGNSVSSYFLGTSFSWTVWTTCRQESSGMISSTKCLTTIPAVNEHGHPGVTDRFTVLLDIIHAFRKESCSALFLPLILAVDILRYRGRLLFKGFQLVRSVEAKTGHGSWGLGRFEVAERDQITETTAELGTALTSVGKTAWQLTLLETIFGHIEDVYREMDSDQRRCLKCESSEEARESDASDASIMQAVRVLRHECRGAKAQCEYLEFRIRIQSSVVSCKPQLCERASRRLGFELMNTC